MPCKEEKESVEKNSNEEVDISKKELVIKTICMYLLAIYIVIRSTWNAHLIIDIVIALFLTLIFSGIKIKKIAKTEPLSKIKKVILLIYTLCLCVLMMSFERSYIEYINDYTSWGIESAVIEIALRLITLICTPCIVFALYRKSKKRGEMTVWMTVFYMDVVTIMIHVVTSLYVR